MRGDSPGIFLFPHSLHPSYLHPSEHLKEDTASLSCLHKDDQLSGIIGLIFFF